MHRIAVSPARQAASALARTIASVSPWSARRSEWPTMTSRAPASAIISAAMSPVWAPEGAAWQSCPPIITGDPAAAATAAAISVAGGQIAMSQAAAAAAGHDRADLGEALPQCRSSSSCPRASGLRSAMLTLYVAPSRDR